MLARSLGLGFLLILGSTRCAKGDEIFTNLVLGQNYNTAIGNPVSGIGVTNGRKGIVLAAQFTPTVGFTFTEAKLALGLTEGTNSVDVYLESDCGGLPCTQIDAMTLNGALSEGSSSLVTVHSMASPLLNAQMPYWLVLTAGAANTVTFWYDNIAGDFSNSSDFAVAFSGDPNGPWSHFGEGQSRPAFEIDGNAEPQPPTPQTPEPSSLLLFTSGLVVVISALQAKRQAGRSRP